MKPSVFSVIAVPAGGAQLTRTAERQPVALAPCNAHAEQAGSGTRAGASRSALESLTSSRFLSEIRFAEIGWGVRG
jgi:hypothetical protein